MAKFHYRESPTEGQRKAFAKYLSEDEELVLVTGLSKAFIRNQFMIYFMFPGIIFGLIFFALGYFLGFEKIKIAIMSLVGMILAAILKTLHTFHANRYILTTRRIMVKKGLFGVKLSAALYDKVTHLEVDQSFFNRILHHGDIIINTAGQNNNEIILKYVDYPMEIKNLLERLINREREQFGLRGVTLTEVEGEIIS